MTANPPARREVVATYLAVIAALFVVKIVLLYLVFPDDDPDLRILNETTKAAMYLAPLVISWRLAGRLRRVLAPNEIADVTGWCALAEFISDLVTVVYVAVASLAGLLDVSWWTIEVLVWIPLFCIIRYAVVLIIAWLVLTFPGKWIGRARVKRLNAAA